MIPALSPAVAATDSKAGSPAARRKLDPRGAEETSDIVHTEATDTGEKDVIEDIGTAVEKPLRRFSATAAGEKELDTKIDLPGIFFFLSFRRTSDQPPPEELPLRALGAKWLHPQTFLLL